MTEKSPIVLMHVVWTPTYNGWEPGMFAGGFKYPKEHGECGEIFNFRPHHGRVYGHVEMLNKSIKIERLGASPGAASAEGVTVVWTAPDPSSGGRKVVGWYRNAEVYSHRSEPKGALKAARTHRGTTMSYQVTAASDDATLVPVERRTFGIPPKKRGQRGVPGQSPLFYLSDQQTPAGRAFEKRLRAYIDSTEAGTLRGRTTKRKQDIERKQKIERTAMDMVTAHFADQGYDVEDVSALDRGYDLEAKQLDVVLCIEVKGRSLEDVYVEFTPNEYSAILKQQRRAFTHGDYRICVVTDALSERSGAKLHHYMCWPGRKMSGRWRLLDGSDSLKFRPVLGAKASNQP